MNVLFLSFHRDPEILDSSGCSCTCSHLGAASPPTPTSTSEGGRASGGRLPQTDGNSKVSVSSPASRALEPKQDPPEEAPPDLQTHRARKPHPHGRMESGEDAALPCSESGLRLLCCRQRLCAPHRRHRLSRPGQRPRQAGHRQEAAGSV